MAVARGNSVPGHPLLWAVTGQRLYLFYSDRGARGFLADPGRFIAARRRANGRRLRAPSRANVRQRLRLVRIAPGDEGRNAEILAGVAEVSGAPPCALVTVPPAAATSRMAGGDVPFPGGAEPRIDIGCAFGDPAELDAPSR